MDKISTPVKNDQIFTPISLMNPNLYSLFSQNVLLKEQSPNNSQKQNNFISPQKQISKNNTKKNNIIEISLINLLNAISDIKSKNINQSIIQNQNENLILNSTPKKEISEKNESISSDSEKQEDSYAVMELLTQKTKRNQKYCNACPHHNAPHYAKGMCSNCYHSRGRKKKPWKCPHLNKFHYAHGLCQNCYQMKYMKKQNDDGIKIVQSSSNLDFEELSNNSIDEIKEKIDSGIKKGKSKSKSKRHSKKKLINN